MAHFDTAETVNQLVTRLIALNNVELDFDTSAEIIANEIMTRLVELIDLIETDPNSSDTTGAGFIVETVQNFLTEIITLKSSETDAGPNVDASTDADIKASAETIAVIIADFIETNKSEIELQSIKRMTHAELVGFTRLAIFNLFI